ncbi:hypothetical protein [Brevibacillus brevis]|uniref:hypothetical protein n=1 Tax=Brevibacillus brevis TaxID=1393 RepID=UPI00165DF8C9|nr:hypothetical protein [Brevibacillus brevis]
MTTKLTPEMLAAIRERAEKAGTGGMEGKQLLYDVAEDDVPILLAEIIRLRAALAEIAHYEAPFGLDAMGYEVLRIMAQQALNTGESGGNAE